MKNYYKYDELVMKTAINLISFKERNNQKIEISNFDKKDEGHLYLLEVAKIVCGQCGGTVVIELPFYKKWFFKPLKGIKAKKKVENGINVSEFLTFTFSGEETTPEEIYKEYYAPKI